MSQPKEIGTLVVVVLKAQHLHQPSFYKQDPYAQVALSGLKKKTKVDPKGGQHPVWDDELRFPVLADAGKDGLNRILEVSCYKDGQREDDVLLGKGTVNIEETLKTGEFDDWVSLETSAGARGQVYLEMTFYANAPPPLMRRPSKLNPSDRLTRPAAYFQQGQQLTPTPTPQLSRSPAPSERKPRQPPQAGVSRIPSSLIPAHNSRSQLSRQTPSNESATPAVRHKNNTLPPLPSNNDLPDTDFGKGLGLPTSPPPGHNVPKPMPPQNRDRVTSMARPPPGALPEPLRRRTLSDTPTLAPPQPFYQLQGPVQAHSMEMTSMARAGVGSTPSVVVEQYAEDYPPTLSISSRSSPELTLDQRGDYDSSSYIPPGQAHPQSNTQGYIPAQTQAYPRTFSPSQQPVALQSPHVPLGHLQQLYDVATPASSFYQQYPGSSSTPQPLSPPQIYSQSHSPQPQQRQVLYPAQSQEHSAPHQQSNLSPQQHLPPPHFSYSPTPHLPNVSQPGQQYNHPSIFATSQPPVATQQPQYSQTPQQPYQPYFIVPPPPPPPPSSSIQPQTPQPYTPQTSHQPHFSPPPPPPPLPPLTYNQGGNGTPTPISVTRSSEVPISPPTPLPQNALDVIPLLQPPTAIPQSSAVPNNIPVTITEAEGMLQEDIEPLRDMARTVNERQEITQEQYGLKHLSVTEKQGAPEDSESSHQIEEDQQNCKELQRQDEQQQEVGRRIQEEEELERREEEQRKQEEEEQRRQKELEHRKREEEEQDRRREEEERRREQEQEDLKRKEEEEQRRREEERRRQEEERRRQEEEERRRKEEERRKREEERRRQEEERKRQEEQIRRERDQAERDRKVAEEAANRRRAEEAEAERRWQEELGHIRARAEQEAADAAFARAQIEAEEAEEAERRRREEEDLALVRQAQEEAEREERLAQERRRQEEEDMEVARREQAHEEELERRRQEERRRRIEEEDREFARRLDMELNLSAE